MKIQIAPSILYEYSMSKFVQYADSDYKCFYICTDKNPSIGVNISEEYIAYRAL